MKYFRHIGEVDPLPLLAQLDARPGLWDQYRIRTLSPRSPHHQAHDIILRFYATTRRIVWPDDAFLLGRVDFPARKLLTAAEPLIERVMGAARCYQDVLVGSVLITKLAPGAMITPHSDLIEIEAESARWPQPALFYDRYQIALEGTGEFVAGDETVKMTPGNVWWFDNAVRHMVTAIGVRPRIALIVDVHGLDMVKRVSWPRNALESVA